MRDAVADFRYVLTRRQELWSCDCQAGASGGRENRRFVVQTRQLCGQESPALEIQVVLRRQRSPGAILSASEIHNLRVQKSARKVIRRAGKCRADLRQSNIPTWTGRKMASFMTAEIDHAMTM